MGLLVIDLATNIRADCLNLLSGHCGKDSLPSR